MDEIEVVEHFMASEAAVGGQRGRCPSSKSRPIGWIAIVAPGVVGKLCAANIRFSKIRSWISVYVGLPKHPLQYSDFYEGEDCMAEVL